MKRLLLSIAVAAGFLFASPVQRSEAHYYYRGYYGYYPRTYGYYPGYRGAYYPRYNYYGNYRPFRSGWYGGGWRGGGGVYLGGRNFGFRYRW